MKSKSMRRGDRPKNSLPYNLRGTFRGYETALARYLVSVNVPLSHFHILRLEWSAAGSTQSCIAKKSFMTESVASQVIQKMEISGLLERKASTSDARKWLVYLTAKGESLQEKTVTGAMDISNLHSSDISAEDMKTTLDVLVKVRDRLETTNKECPPSIGLV